jgi:hypothetical protein
MDPLSTTASIIAVIQLAQSTFKYAKDVKNAGKVRDRILKETSSTHDLLLRLMNSSRWKDEYSATMTSLQEIGGPLDLLKGAFVRLEELLKPPDTDLKRIEKALKWHFKKDEVEEILSTIDRLKLSFSLAEQNNHM